MGYELVGVCNPSVRLDAEERFLPSFKENQTSKVRDGSLTSSVDVFFLLD